MVLVLIFLDSFDVLISKIIFFKKNYFNIFSIKVYIYIYIQSPSKEGFKGNNQSDMELNLDRY
jgi:hypothetical protein